MDVFIVIYFSKKEFLLFTLYLASKSYDIYDITHGVYILMVSTEIFNAILLRLLFLCASFQHDHIVIWLQHLCGYFRNRYF